MRPDPIIDLASLDFTRPVATKADLLEANPQRFEMEQVDAVVYLDIENHIIVGYKDVRADEFWARGHMPGYPLFPGVLMCEAGAQLVGYHITVAGLKKSDYIVFGGMDEVRFRGVVRPGDRLVLAGKGKRVGTRQAIFHIQGTVNGQLVFHADIIGMQFNKSG
jgi:3-hydroxyacyl-[acyl-carrier-protein] dehydratase